MSQNSLQLQDNSSTVFQHHFTSRVWHESQSKIASNYDLSKSMIKNIPGTKKSMSQNLQMMLLFQAAQIQRLTQNLQQLRNYKRQIQKGPMNLKSMQIQIKELTDEIQGTVRKQKQIAILRQKYEAALKNLNEFDISNQELDRKFREKLLQVRQLKSQLNEKDLSVSQSQRQTDQRQIQIKKLNDSIVFLSKQREDLEYQNDSYMDKLALLSQQMVRLRQSNNKLKSNKGSTQSQIQQLKQENFSLKSLLQKQRLQNQQLSIMSMKFQQQIEQFKSTIDFLKQNQQHSNIQKSNHMVIIQQRNEQYFNQINRYKSQLMQKNRQLHERQSIISELNNRQQRNSEQFSNMKKQFIRLQQVLTQQQESHHILMEQNRQLQYNFQSQKSYFSQEINNTESKHKQLQFNKDSQILELKRQNQHLNAELSRLGSIVQKISEEKYSLNTTLNTSLQELSRQLQQREGIIREKQHQITQFQRTIQQLSLANRQLNEGMNSQAQEQNRTIEHFEQVNQRLQTQIARLNRQKSQIIHQLSNKQMSQSSISMRYETLMRDIETKNDQNKNLRKQLQKYQKQNNNLLRTIDQRNRNIQNLNIQVHQISKGLDLTQRDISQKQRRAMTDIRQLQEKIQQKQKAILHSRQRTIGLENQLNLITHQLERLNIIVREKDALLIQRMHQINRLFKSQQEVRFQIKSLKEAVSHKEIQISYKEQTEQSLRQNFLHQINELKNLITSKDEELIRCNQYILKMNEKICEVNTQQNYLLKVLQNSNNLNLNTKEQNHQNFTKLFEVLKQFKSQSINNFVDLNKRFDDQNNVQQNYNYSIQQKFGFIQNNITQSHQLADKQKNNLSELINQRQSKINELERQLPSIKLKNQHNNQYAEIMSELTKIKVESIDIKTLINQIRTFSNSSQTKYTEQLQKNQQTIKQLNYKFQQIYSHMQELIQKFNQVTHQLNHFKQLRSVQITEMQTSHFKQISITKKQTQDHFMKLFQEMEQQLNREIHSLKQQNHTIMQENQRLQQKLNQVQQMIIQKKQEIIKFHQLIKKNNTEYIRKNQDQKNKIEQQILSKEEQIKKYQQILRLRQEQIKQNSIIFKQMQANLSKKQEQIKRLKGLSKKIEQLQGQIENLLNQKNNQVSEQQISNQLDPLKQNVRQLQEQNGLLQSRLNQALSKLNLFSEHLSKLKLKQSSAVQKLQSLVQNQSKYEDCLSKIQKIQYKNSQLQFTLTEKQSLIRQFQIDREFYQKTKSTNTVVLTKYEFKLKQLIQESQKFGKFIQLLEQQNHGLKRQNSNISLQLKKARIAQQKIRILNIQIDRLSIQKIDLDSELTEYRLQLSGDSSLERRYQQQLCVMVLLFAQIESLRIRLKNKEQEVELTHRSVRRSMSSSRHG